jgi:isoquinoline 1-oxidoreductase subunit beta
VLERAAALAGWGTPLPEGEGRGLALCDSFGSIVAEVAHVRVDSAGVLRVLAVDAVVDCGDVISPDAAAAQVEGGILFGLSAALMSAITIEQGRIVQTNFRDYPMPRIKDTPQIRVEFLRSDAPLGGLGEPAVPPIAPAVANAIFAATGVRVRALPFSQTPLRKA